MSGWFERNRARYGPDWDLITALVKSAAGWSCEACGAPHGPSPNVLTVDHIDHVPENMTPENLIALCQRCHLARQGMTRRGVLPAGASRLQVAIACAAWRNTAKVARTERFPTLDAQVRARVRSGQTHALFARGLRGMTWGEKVGAVSPLAAFIDRDSRTG